jgi:glycosyltransferase involved in cell wall biosynthesis
MGLLAPPRNPQALGEAIVTVLDNPEAYHKPLDVIDAAFNFDETIDRYERHLQTAARAARGEA